jgi:hypothetical protein
MNVITIWTLFAVAFLISAIFTLAGGHLVLTRQKQRLHARGCRCELTLFVDYLRSDCPVHGWQVEQATHVASAPSLTSDMPSPLVPPRRSRPFQPAPSSGSSQAKEGVYAEEQAEPFDRAAQPRAFALFP